MKVFFFLNTKKVEWDQGRTFYRHTGIVVTVTGWLRLRRRRRCRRGKLVLIVVAGR